MERSQCFPCTSQIHLKLTVTDSAPAIQHSKPSTDGQLIATLLQSRLLLRLSSNGEIVRTIPLDNGFSTRCRYLRWSRDNGTVEEGQEHLGSGAPARVHLLLADDDTVRVYNAYDTQWSAVITGASSNFGKIANVEFGNTADEILIFSDFGVKATLWSLITSRGSEIRDPKFTNKGYSYRPETGHLTILTRPTAHDVVMLLAPSTYELLCSFTLATVDAQGLVWSPDGKWLVTWDAASSGYKVLVYTADGHLYRTVTGGQDANKIGLGIKAVAWSAAGAYLAVGGYDGRLALLNATTVNNLNISPMGCSSSVSSHPGSSSNTLPQSIFLEHRYGKNKSPLRKNEIMSRRPHWCAHLPHHHNPPIPLQRRVSPPSFSTAMGHT